MLLKTVKDRQLEIASMLQKTVDPLKKVRNCGLDMKNCWRLHTCYGHLETRDMPQKTFQTCGNDTHD